MFIGREHELEQISYHLKDRSKAQLIVVYGRRRVGKSTLIAQACKREKRVLFFEGLQGERTKVQIDQFLDDLSRQTGRVRLNASNWREVFQGLGELIESGRWVLVFDEFPWMGAGRTKIVSALKLHWDRWAKNPNICLFLCGSVASFMTRHVIHSKALHNRKTLEMCLSPLTPKESALFLAKRGLWEKAQLYMTLGGVPKHLEQINPRVSLAKNLNRMCFSANGFFVEEYETLFKEQFKSIKVYEKVVKELAHSHHGISSLSRKLNVKKGGGFNEQIGNLVRAQFVREYTPVKINGHTRRKTKLFKLVDPFLIFYFRYIHKNVDLISRNTRNEDLFKAIAGPSLQQYYGYAFERLCEDSIDLILEKIGLSLTDIEQMGPYFQQGKRGEGLQIDWLVIRRDNVWSPIEFKYTNKPVGSSLVHEVEQKISRLRVPKEISVEPVAVSACGVTQAVRDKHFFSQTLELKDLLA